MKNLIVVNTGHSQSGTGIYANLLAKAMPNSTQIDIVFDGNRYGGSRQITRYYFGQSGWANMSFTFFFRKIEIKTDGNVIFHASNAAVPLFLKRDPQVVTFFHLNPLITPHNYPRWFTIATRIAIRKLETRLVDSKIVVCTNFGRELLLENSKITDDRIFVVYPYADVFEVDELERAHLKHILGLEDKKVIIAVGTSVEHKNFKTLYNAIKGTDMYLIRVGAGPKDSSESLENIRYIEGIPHSELGNLYNASDVLAFTGTDEGFGFPLIEALATGLPVVGNKCTTVPEILGGAGILVEDPYDPTELREALYKALDYRNHYSDLSRARSQSFRLDRFRNQMAGIYEDLS